MKITLSFDFEEEEDRLWHKQCLASKDLVRVLDEIAQNFREHRKWDSPLMTEEEFYILLSSYDINLDNL